VDMPAPDFTLRDQYGRPFRLSDRRGRVLLLFFGYTHCPDACPLTLSIWKKVRDNLGDRAKDVDFVYATIDPKRDTPERLRDHLIAFSPDFIGLSGTPEALDQVYHDYGVVHEETSVSATATGYLFNHTSITIVIDRRGRWRLGIPYGVGSNEITADVSRLLVER
jgi:protein SCO1